MTAKKSAVTDKKSAVTALYILKTSSDNRVTDSQHASYEDALAAGEASGESVFTIDKVFCNPPSDS